MKMSGAVIGLGMVLLAGVTGCGGESSDVGGIDAAVTFRVTGSSRTMSCISAGVAYVQLRFYDAEPGGLLRGQMIRLCVPGERYRTLIERGAFRVQVQGLNGRHTVCYESNHDVVVRGGRSEVVDIVSEQHPTGDLNGCQYPVP